MRHLHSGRKLGVAPHHRRALIRSLTLALIERDSITTTRARAKELRSYADRIITFGKKGDVSSRRQLLKILGTTQTKTPGENRVRGALEKVYSVLVPRFTTRPGGYTQIFHLARRRAGDNSEMCLMRYIPAVDDKKEKAKKAPKKEEKKAKAAASDKEESKAKSVSAKETSDKKKKTKKEE